MAGANTVFNNLFDVFQNTEFFQDAIYSFSWTDVIHSSIDRVTGDSIETSTVYSSNCFLVNPSKTERPSQSIFKNLKAGDIAVLVQQNELLVAPELDKEVTFNGKTYTCKEIVADPVSVTWKFLLRG